MFCGSTRTEVELWLSQKEQLLHQSSGHPYVLEEENGRGTAVNPSEHMRVTPNSKHDSIGGHLRHPPFLLKLVYY